MDRDGAGGGEGGQLPRLGLRPRAAGREEGGQQAAKQAGKAYVALHAPMIGPAAPRRQGANCLIQIQTRAGSLPHRKNLTRD